MITKIAPTSACLPIINGLSVSSDFHDTDKAQSTTIDER